MLTPSSTPTLIVVGDADGVRTAHAVEFFELLGGGKAHAGVHRGRARRHVAASLVRLYGDFGRGLEPAAVSGPPDACVEGVREVAEAGAELVLFTPFFNEAEQMERLAAEVAPKLL